MHIGRYEFGCTMQDEALLPRYKGSMFRGAFGGALKRAVCVAKKQECSSCLLAGRCIYARTFEAGRTPDGESASATPPVPYLIEPPLETRTRYEAGSSFDFSLLLFGEINTSLPYFVYAFELMGESGIGKKLQDKRGGYCINEIRSNGAIIYESTHRKLNPPVPKTVEFPTCQEAMEPAQVTIRFLTPLRLKHKNSLAEQLPFHLLVRSMLRRISSLFEAFGNGEPTLDYRGLVSRAEKIRINASSLRWHDWERYSGRQEQTMMMGGLLGAITYSGNLAEYLPLLELCKTLHIGKQSSFGLGHFEYQIVAESN